MNHFFFIVLFLLFASVWRIVYTKRKRCVSLWQRDCHYCTFLCGTFLQHVLPCGVRGRAVQWTQYEGESSRQDCNVELFLLVLSNQGGKERSEPLWVVICQWEIGETGARRERGPTQPVPLAVGGGAPAERAVRTRATVFLSPCWVWV